MDRYASLLTLRGWERGEHGHRTERTASLAGICEPCKKHQIVLRSIDMGATEVVRSFDELRDFRKLRSPFSIPKAALGLCGFLPEFAAEWFGSLDEQLAAFGGGLELTLLAAIPAGSGLGTSSLLASTVLGALNNFCGLQWSRQDICTETLVLEQLLTSGGGWQDSTGDLSRGEAAGIGTRFYSEATDQLAAGLPIHGSALCFVPLVVLHGYHAGGQKYIGRDRSGYVPELGATSFHFTRDEAPCAGDGGMHSAGRLGTIRKVNSKNVGTEETDRQGYEPSRSGTDH